VIDRLGEAMLPRAGDEAERACKMLSAIDDERVVPYFIKLSKERNYSSRFAASGVLGRYKNDEAFSALKALFATTPDDLGEDPERVKEGKSSVENVRLGAIGALSWSPHPDAMGFVLGQSADRSPSVRLRVLQTAAKSKSVEGRKVVEKMTGDADERVRTEAVRLLKKLEAG
jgi:HEAT repeat protein